MIKRFVKNLLHKDLSYQIHGADIEVRKDFRPGHKEQLLKKILVSISLILLLFSGLKTQAAVLYLEPASGEYYHGDTFIVEIRIDTEGECINTVKVDLNFSQDILRTVDFSQGNSILTVWLKEPEISQESGLISFIGGIPGGYCGTLPGEPGRPDLLGRIIFGVDETVAKIERKTEAKIDFLDTSQVLLNDGFGTPAKLTLKDAIFTILSEKSRVPKKEWQEELKKDNIPPEPFKIEIHQTPEIFEGKYFIVFSTTDKQTGIDHYEVAEQRPIIGIIMRKVEWKKAESPYLLVDQSLQSIIKVKAVDKAGNERIVEYLPLKKPLPWWIIIVILIVIIGFSYWLYKILEKKKND